MALTLGDNFSYQGAKPLDARLKYDTLANMKAVADATMYDGCMAYCAGTDKTYQWKSTNTVDESTGKWRELQTGGGGHTIEDSEGTDLTQRDTLQFGEGFKAEDDDTNEKTVISPDVMQNGDMDDVITPLPSVGNKLPVLFDESGAERVVGWYKYANGTKKPVYERCYVATITALNTWIEVSGGAIPNIDYMISLVATVGANLYIVGFDGDMAYNDSLCYVNGVKYATKKSRTGQTVKATIQYTKTTDIAE